ncbi:protein-tyrosine-phosphatase PTP1, partial [Tanacetum coccineum]
MIDNVISLTELNRRSSVANLKVNASKNRYERVIPFDANRVNIDPTKNHSSGLGYINASFITAEANPPDQTVSLFIATQGPLPTTYEDFWKMVLQYHCPAVVMLTRLVDPPEDDMGNGDIMCGDYFQGENGVRIIGGNIHTVTRKFIKTNSSLELRHLEVNYAEASVDTGNILCNSYTLKEFLVGDNVLRWCFMNRKPLSSLNAEGLVPSQ